MQFSYSAKSLRGEMIDGVIDAVSIAGARQLLREQGLFALALSPQQLNRTADLAARPILWKTRVSKQELLLLTTQLTIMCRAGVDLAEALQNVTVKCRNLTLKTALEEIYKDVADGLSFSAAMKRQSDIFGETYVASLQAGEASGKLIEVLERMADLLRNEIKFRLTLKAAISYPLVLMGVCVLVIGALVLFVLPNFEGVFFEMGIQPPATTQFLLEFSGELRRRLWLWGGVTIFVAILGYKLFWTDRFRRLLNNLGFRAAVLGEVLQSLVCGRLFLLMGSMLQSGVPLIQALQLCRLAMRSVCYQDLIDTMQEEVLNGRKIGPVLDKSTVVPVGAAQMIGIAEQSGKLGNVMQLVGEYYEAEGQRKLQELAKLLEPAIIIIMGIVVAFVVASIMLPMLDISTMSSE